MRREAPSSPGLPGRRALPEAESQASEAPRDPSRSDADHHVAGKGSSQHTSPHWPNCLCHHRSLRTHHAMAHVGKHVALAEQALGAPVIENDPRICLRGHLKSHLASL
jgi:hypothetical protein